jgi:hypothetical protein
MQTPVLGPGERFKKRPYNRGSNRRDRASPWKCKLEKAQCVTPKKRLRAYKEFDAKNRKQPGTHR